MRTWTILLIFLATQCQSQVLDVNGDNVVGPHEAIAVHEQWKGPANAANEHDHLGQSWRPEIEGRGLTLRGNFPDLLLVPFKDGKQIPVLQGAALILDNTSVNGADLQLGGDGTIEAIGRVNSELQLLANGEVEIVIDADNQFITNQTFHITWGQDPTNYMLRLFADGLCLLYGDLEILDENGSPVARISGEGDMDLIGSLDVDGAINGMFIGSAGNKSIGGSPSHVLSSHLPAKVFMGETILNDEGEAVIELPPEVSSHYYRFQYRITPIGVSAPGLFISEEVNHGCFKIAGGVAEMKVNWEVVGFEE